MRYGIFFFFKQKTAYEMRISDWSSDVCSSDLIPAAPAAATRPEALMRLPRLAAPAAPEALDGPPAFAVALRHDYGSYLVSLGLISLGNIVLLPIITAYLSPADLGLSSLVEPTKHGRASCWEKVCHYV